MIGYGFLKTALVGIISFSAACCTDNKTSTYPPMGEIRSATELKLTGLTAPAEFKIRNPNYNPSWHAKLIVNAQQKSDIESDLKSKRLLNLASYVHPSPSEIPWWTPDKNARRYSYMTSANSSVSVFISENSNDLYIDWTCP